MLLAILCLITGLDVCIELHQCFHTGNLSLLTHPCKETRLKSGLGNWWHNPCLPTQLRNPLHTSHTAVTIPWQKVCMALHFMGNSSQMYAAHLFSYSCFDSSITCKHVWRQIIIPAALSMLSHVLSLSIPVHLWKRDRTLLAVTHYFASCLLNTTVQ